MRTYSREIQQYFVSGFISDSMLDSLKRIFQNDDSEFDRARSLFKEALLQNKQLNLAPKDIKITPGRVAVKVAYNDVDFDLIPAPILSRSPNEQASFVLVKVVIIVQLISRKNIWGWQTLCT